MRSRWLLSRGRLRAGFLNRVAFYVILEFAFICFVRPYLSVNINLLFMQLR